MKFKNLDIKNIFKKRSFHRKDYQNLSLKAAHDWKLVLAVFSIIIIVVATLNFYLFIRVSEGEAFSRYDSSEIEKEAINLKDMEKIISFFDGKALKINNLVNSSEWDVDPSL